LEEQNSFSGEVGTTLMKTIQQNEEKNKRLQKSIDKIAVELEETRQTRPNKKVTQSENSEEKKNRLLASIQQTGTQNRALQKKLPEARRKLAEVQERKRNLVDQHSALKNEVRAAQS